jgi:putative aldouronate transport system permease protein
MIDGCSTTRTFLTIVLPLSKALMGVMVLYYGVGHWNSYFNALIYLTDRTKIPLQLVLREILVEQQIASSLLELDGMAEDMQAMQMKMANLIKYSVIVVSSLPVLIVYPFLQKYFDKGVMLGSLNC